MNENLIPGIKKVIVLGSGALKIGEAGEFDIMVGTSSADVQTKRINWEK